MRGENYMKKILVISWFYPPINSSEGLVTFKLINNSKYAYDVFTQNFSLGWTYGANVDFDNKPNINIINCKSTDIDSWINEAYEFFVKNKDDYEYIMTRSMPKSCHSVGIKIKKEFPNIKWIASFGDPIKDNPYNFFEENLYSGYSPKYNLRLPYIKLCTFAKEDLLKDAEWNNNHPDAITIRNDLEEIQDTTFMLADKIILNNPTQKKYMIDNHFKYLKKTIVINHSYDKNLYPIKTINENKKISFVFIGHLDKIRNANSLFTAINELNINDNDLSNKVEFVFYGDMFDDDKEYVKNNNLSNLIKINGPIPYRDSLAKMVNADWLIHIDGDISKIVNKNIFFAAKLADYFGSKTKILAITMKYGDSTKSLKKSNALVLSHDSSEIKQYLYKIIYDNFNIKPNVKYIEKFDAINNAKKFDKKVIGV